MSNIIDLDARRGASQDRADPEFIKHDDFGREMQLYLLQYQFDGSTWGGVSVWAYSMADAEARVESMRGSIVLLGQAIMQEPDHG